MNAIGAYEAKTHLPRLLDEVASTGRTYIITKHGQPVAYLGPIRARAEPPRDVIAALREARKGVRFGGEVRDAIEQGRR